MPGIKFGDTFSYSSDNYIKLAGKGDKIHFRLLNNPVYEGKHFIKDGEDLLIEPCVRINNKAECSYCERFFELKKAEKIETDETKLEAIKKEANKYKPAVTFHFPVINRKEEIFQIFQAPKSVFDKLNQQSMDGINVLEKDFIVTRTEAPGSDYYSLTRLDSSDTKPLTDKELGEAEKGKADLSGLVGIKKDPTAPKKTAKASAKTTPVDDDPIMAATNDGKPMPWEE